MDYICLRQDILEVTIFLVFYKKYLYLCTKHKEIEI